MITVTNVFTWPAILLAYLTMYGKAYKTNYYSLAAYIAGIAAAPLLLHYADPTGWYFD